MPLCAVIAVALAALLLPPAASAAPLGLSDCAPREGVHQCSGLVETWDGVPLDTTVTLPREGATGLPLVVAINGFANSKHEYLDPASTAYTDNAYAWARAGYAVLTHTARGTWGSCGTPEARAARPAACARGYIHLADVRYEARDVQELAGRLVDEGVADARRIGVTGDSYGGGQSLMLAALRDRVVLPDGTLVPWRSPAGTPLEIAGAAVVIPWTDLIYAIAPNGSTLTYAIAPTDASRSPVGVEKASVAAAVYAAGQHAIGPGQPIGEPFVPGRPMGWFAPPGVDPEADVTSWVARASAGPPYTDPTARAIVDTLTRFHSAYHLDASRPPAPLFIASGFTDDLFPVDEVTRFANRMRRDHPAVPLSLMLADFGHQRASNKPADRLRLLDGVHAWLDHHVRGDAPAPPTGVTASTQTCPRDAPSEGPFAAETFEALARGEVRFASDAPQSVLPAGGDPAVGVAVDPATGGGDACATTRPDDAPGTASYRLLAATGDGYTLLGAPTIVAEMALTGERDTAQVAARLWDVAPGGATQTLVARGLYRPSGRGTEVFQLHPNGWRFERGHVARLELVGNDAPYARPSNAPYRVDVRRLELRLPVREAPDCTTVLGRAAPVLPAGYELAPGVDARASSACAQAQRGDGADAPAARRRRQRTTGTRSATRRRTRTAAAPAQGRASDDGGTLALTGLDLALVAGAGLVLLAGGGALRRRVRRRPVDDLLRP